LIEQRLEVFCSGRNGRSVIIEWKEVGRSDDLECFGGIIGVKGPESSFESNECRHGIPRSILDFGSLGVVLVVEPFEARGDIENILTSFEYVVEA
jgi:hypothetical protein